MHFRALFVPLLLLLLAGPVMAQEKAGIGDPERPLVEAENEPSLIDQVRAEAIQQKALAIPPLRKFPHLDWHGSFRFRADLLTYVHLGTYQAYAQNKYVGTSLFLPPLIDNYTNSSGGAAFTSKLAKEKEKTVGTANIRLRLSPDLYITDNIRIGTTVDLLDNLVLGSTPEYLGNVSSGTSHYAGSPGPGIPLDTFSGSQVPPRAGLNSLSDSMEVKEAFAEWTMDFSGPGQRDGLNLGVLTVGRFAYDWGLGINTSRGDYARDDMSLTPMNRFKALDAEWGNYLDRAMWRYDFGLVSLMAGYGWIASGPTSRVAMDATGQPYDLEQQDDLSQIDFAIYSRPQTRADYIARRKRLFAGKPVFDWGLYVNFRRQETLAVVPASGQPADFTVDYDNMALVDRDAWIVTPDLWLRMDWRPSPKLRYYAALEAVAVIGNIGNATGTDPATSVDVQQFGAALETNFTINLVSFGLDAGFASGDPTDPMAAAVNPYDPLTGTGNTAWGSDNRLGAFAFNRNYFLDMLLYKEVLGTVTNSVYFRPHFDFDIIPTEERAFGGALAVIYGMAVDPAGVPGNDRNLGLEVDAHLFYEVTNTFLATGGFGALIPFGGLDRPEDYIYDGVTAKEAAWAWTLQGNLYFVF
jgi:uncharacterized protein (TIGR04551 family)